MEPTGLGLLGAEIRRLREQRKISLRSLSAELRAAGATEGSSHQHLSAVERGTEWPSQDLVDAIGRILNNRERLLRIYREAKAPTDDPAQAAWMRRIDALIAKGRLGEAKAALENQASDGSDQDRVHALLRLGDVEHLLGDADTGDAKHLESAELANTLGFSRDVAVALDRIGTRWTEAERFEEAADLIKEWLQRQVENSRIWRRLGVIEWYAGNFAEAYAALTTALQLGHRRRNILHARGQVLAEWGCSREAILDLDEVMTAKDLSPKAVAAVVRARALASGDRVAAP